MMFDFQGLAEAARRREKWPQLTHAQRRAWYLLFSTLIAFVLSLMVAGLHTMALGLAML